MLTDEQLAERVRMLGAVGETVRWWQGKLLEEYAQTVAELAAEIRHLRHVLTGEEKARDLLMKGMESQCELMDGLKQEARHLKALVAAKTTEDA